MVRVTSPVEARGSIVSGDRGVSCEGFPLLTSLKARESFGRPPVDFAGTLAPPARCGLIGVVCMMSITALSRVTGIERADVVPAVRAYEVPGATGCEDVVVESGAKLTSFYRTVRTLRSAIRLIYAT